MRDRQERVGRAREERQGDEKAEVESSTSNRYLVDKGNGEQHTDRNEAQIGAAKADPQGQRPP